MSETFAMQSRLDDIDSARRWAASHAGEAWLGEAEIHDLELAMTEVLSNVIRHAYGGDDKQPIELTLTIGDNQLELRVRDYGASFDIADYTPPALEEPSAGGYGLYLIEQLMDEVSRRPMEGGGTVVSLIKHRRKGRHG